MKESAGNRAKRRAQADVEQLAACRQQLEMLEGFVQTKDGRSLAKPCKHLGEFQLIAAFLRVVIENLESKKVVTLDAAFREASERFSAVSLPVSPTHIKTVHYDWVMGGCSTSIAPAVPRAAMPNLFDEHPGLREWAMKWTYQQVHHRAKGTEAFCADSFRKEMNSKFAELLIRSDAADGADDDGTLPPMLQWKTTTPALRYLKLLDMHFAPMASGMCFDHERTDVVAARGEVVKLYDVARRRMHCFYDDGQGNMLDVHDPTSIIGTGEGELDR